MSVSELPCRHRFLRHDPNSLLDRSIPVCVQPKISITYITQFGSGRERSRQGLNLDSLFRLSYTTRLTNRIRYEGIACMSTCNPNYQKSKTLRAYDSLFIIIIFRYARIYDMTWKSVSNSCPGLLREELLTDTLAVNRMQLWTLHSFGTY